MIGEYAVYLFSLLAAVLWGMGVVVAKRGLTLGGTVWLLGIVSTVVGTILFWGAMILQRGGEVFAHLTVGMVVVFAFAGLTGSGLGRLFHYSGIRRVGATIGEAGGSTHPLFAAVIAFVFIGEPIRLVELLGMVFIILGLIVFSVSKGGDLSGWEPWELLFPIAAAALFGVGNVLRRYGFVGTDATPVEGSALNATAGLVFFVTYVLFTRRTDVLSVSRNTYLYIGGAGVLIPLGLLALMVALSLGRVVVVVPLSGTAPLFAIAFSYLFLGDVERVTGGVVAGSLCTVFGIYLLTGL